MICIRLSFFFFACFVSFAYGRTSKVVMITCTKFKYDFLFFSFFFRIWFLVLCILLSMKCAMRFKRDFLQFFSHLWLLRLKFVFIFLYLENLQHSRIFSWDCIIITTFDLPNPPLPLVENKNVKQCNTGD